MDIMSFKRAPIFLSFRLQIDIDWIIKGDFIIQAPSSNGSKVMGCQSWRSKIFHKLHSESLLSERPGFESRTVQTLKAHIFAALWPTGPKTNFFEGSDLYLLV